MKVSATLIRKATVMSVKYPEVEVTLTGQDGNAFAVMGAVTKALRKSGCDSSVIKAYQTEAMAGDYDNLLQVTFGWVNVR